jgi:hypothetical protein
MKGKLQLAILVTGIVASTWPSAAEGMSAAPSIVQAEAPPSETMDQLLARVALYPDALLAQILMCADSPFQVGELNEWLAANSALEGSAIQEAAQAEGFDPSFIALSAFPQVVQMMGQDLEWTRQLGEAFAKDRSAVFDGIQRLRAQAMAAGNLQSTSQQKVGTQTTESGQEVIVIEPANPEIIYVPQYDPVVVYTTPPTTVIVEDDSGDEAAAALVGFTAGVIIGAVANDYYYGPYGYPGGIYMYNDAWDDYYDHREDAREDWQDHREDNAGDREERREDRPEGASERQTARQEGTSERQTARQEGTSTAQARGGEAAATSARTGEARGSSTARTGSPSASTGNYGSRGYSMGGTQGSGGRSGTGSSAFSGYQSGSASRAASSRGRSSMSRSRGGGRRR